MSVEEKRIAIKAFIKRVEFDGDENFNVFMNGDEDVSLEEIFSNEAQKEPLREDSERDTDAFPRS